MMARDRRHEREVSARRNESGGAPLQSCLEGGIPGTDGNAALVLFREHQKGKEGERSAL